MAAKTSDIQQLLKIIQRHNYPNWVITTGVSQTLVDSYEDGDISASCEYLQDVLSGLEAGSNVTITFSDLTRAEKGRGGAKGKTIARTFVVPAATAKVNGTMPGFEFMAQLMAQNATLQLEAQKERFEFQNQIKEILEKKSIFDKLLENPDIQKQLPGVLAQVSGRLLGGRRAAAVAGPTPQPQPQQPEIDAETQARIENSISLCLDYDPDFATTLEKLANFLAEEENHAQYQAIKAAL